MSGPQKIWNDGEGITTPELQRAADSAAFADDRALIIMAHYPEQNPSLSGGSPYSSALDDQKSVMPIHDHLGSQEIAIISGGNLVMTPAVYIASDHPAGADGSEVLVSHLESEDKALTSGNSLAFTSNSSGNPRIDLVYAVVTRSVTTTGSRIQKDTTTGAISLQTLNLEKTTSLTFVILAGTPAGSPVAPSLPADGVDTYNFALLQVTIPNGYVTAGAITRSNVLPVFRRATIRENAHRNMYELAQHTFPTPTDYSRAEAPPSWFGQFSVGYFAATVNSGIADPQIKMSLRGGARYRLMRVTVVLPADHSGYGAWAGLSYPPPTTVIKGGGSAFSTNFFFSGDGVAAPNSFASPIWSDPAAAFGLAGAGDDLRVYIDSSGFLCVGFSGTFGANTNVVIIVEATDRLVF